MQRALESGYRTIKLKVGRSTIDEDLHRTVAVDMVALIAPGVMVTVTVLGPEDATDLGALVEAVAKTATRPTATP